jgi:hypothetical protein
VRNFSTVSMSIVVVIDHDGASRGSRRPNAVEITEDDGFGHVSARLRQ